MIIAKKIRLFPTKEQEEKMIESCNVARYIYNYTLAKQEQNYKDGNQFIKNTEIRKELTSPFPKSKILVFHSLCSFLSGSLYS